MENLLSNSILEDLEYEKMKKIKEKKGRSHLKEIILHIIFASICFALAYTNFNKDFFTYRQSVKNFLHPNEKYLKTNKISEIWIFKRRLYL